MRAGAIGLGDPGYLEDLAQQRHREAVAVLLRTVPDLVDVGLHCDERVGSTAVDQLVKQHAEKPFDAIFVMQVSWSRPAVLLQLVRAFPNLPMIVYSPGSEIIEGVIHSMAPAAGASATVPLLRSHAVKFKYVWSLPGQPIDEAMFLPFLRAAAAVRRLRGVKLGMVGFGDMRLQATAFDVQELHRTFGVEVESVDMLELQKGMDALDEQSVLEQASALTGGWKYHEDRKPSPASLKKVVGAYLVLDRWASERGWGGVSIKCPTGVAAHMGFTPCMAGCLLARKCHFVCENDIPGLLTQVIVYSKKLLTRYTPLQVLLYSYIVLFVFMLPVTLYYEPSGFGKLLHFGPTVWGGLIVLAVLQYALSMILFLHVLARLDATQTGLMNYLIPFLGVVIAWAVLGETLTLFMVLGGLLALGSTLLATVFDTAETTERIAIGPE